MVKGRNESEKMGRERRRGSCGRKELGKESGGRREGERRRNLKARKMEKLQQ